MVCLKSKLNATSLNAKVAREQISNVINNETTRYNIAIEKLISRRKYWVDNPKYSFQFEEVLLSEKNLRPKNVAANRILV